MKYRGKWIFYRSETCKHDENPLPTEVAAFCPVSFLFNTARLVEGIPWKWMGGVWGCPTLDENCLQHDVM